LVLVKEKGQFERGRERKYDYKHSFEPKGVTSLTSGNTILIDKNMSDLRKLLYLQRLHQHYKNSHWLSLEETETDPNQISGGKDHHDYQKSSSRKSICFSFLKISAVAMELPVVQ
jgi:hypothetical protein